MCNLRRLLGVAAAVGVAGFLVLGIVPAASAAGVSTVIDGMTFTADDSAVGAGATLTAYSGPTDVTIPTAIPIGSQIYEVTAIGDFAFNNTGLTSVVLPSQLQSIGVDAFSQNSLTAITLPDGLTTISDEAFLGNEITTVTIPDSVTTLGSEAFLQNALTSVSIGSGLSTLGFDVFATNHLSAVSIPPTVTTIGAQAFYDNLLTTVTVAGSVTSIGSFAFAANHLTTVTLGAPLTTVAYSAFNTNDLTSVTFPSTVTSIGDTAFIGNPNLTSAIFDGMPPTTFTGAGGSSSLGTASGIVVGYLFGHSATETPGGFPNPWQGFATQELVTTTFDMGGHGAQVAPQLDPIGSPAVKPVAPSEAQWIFRGWYNDAALTTPANFTAALAGNQTLFARWDPELAVTGVAINYEALWGAILSAIVGIGLVCWSSRRRRDIS
jgi:uncharacterized repeat protein (TIGR02543 family)